MRYYTKMGSEGGCSMTATEYLSSKGEQSLPGMLLDVNAMWQPSPQLRGAIHRASSF